MAFQGFPFRYFGIGELGDEGGRLHFHLALHTERWITPEIFLNEWRSRTAAELVRSVDGYAGYASKYITKDISLGRVRASKNYGVIPPGFG